MSPVDFDSQGSNVPCLDIPLPEGTDDLLVAAESLDYVDYIGLAESKKSYESHGWKYVTLWGLEKNVTNAHNGEITTLDKYQSSQQEIIQVFRDYLQRNGIDARTAFVFALEPGGYVAPHKDQGTAFENERLYIPLNWPDQNLLTIWPVGNLDIAVGKMYLFNNADFVHGVWNRSNQRRYVLVIKVDREKNAKLMHELKQRYQRFFIDQDIGLSKDTAQLL